MFIHKLNNLFRLDCGPPLEKTVYNLCMLLASTWFFARWYLEDVAEELAQGAGNFLGIVQNIIHVRLSLIWGDRLL
jgi:hypothetical protein